MAQKRSCSGECRGHRREYCLVLLQIQRISSVKSVREVQTPFGKNASISERTPELTNPRRGSVRKGGRRVESGAAWAGTQSVIESFLSTERTDMSCSTTEYGVTGRKVLEAYIDWMKYNSPEGWHRKKKYNYGNVLHMPEADYLETILRKTRKEARHMQKNAEYQREERLTMTRQLSCSILYRGLPMLRSARK